MAKEKENGAPATSPTLLGRLANLAGLGGSAQPAEATAAAPAPSAPVLAVPLTDEPTSVIPNGSVEQPVTSASASVPAGEPTVAAAEDRVPSPPPPPSPQAAQALALPQVLTLPMRGFIRLDRWSHNLNPRSSTLFLEFRRRACSHILSPPISRTHRSAVIISRNQSMPLLQWYLVLLMARSRSSRPPFPPC